MSRITSRWSFAVLLVFLAVGLFAQDVHYAQTGNSPLNLNPGLAGVFDGNHRFAANLRRQWGSVPVPYFQLAGSWDTRLADEKEQPTPWGIGIQFNYDRAGDAGLSFSHLGLNGSYAIRLFPQKKQYLSFGVSAGIMQRAINPDKLTFDDQYTLKEGFSSFNPTSETIDNTTKLMGDLSAGVNYHVGKENSRLAFDFGAALFHLNEPKKNFMEQENARLQNRSSLYAVGLLPVASKFDLLLSASGQFQQASREVVLGTAGFYHLSTKRTQELGALLGLFYRAGDSVIPTAGIHYQGWQVQLSYDINVSPLKEATLRRAGPEVSVIHILRYVPQMAVCKTCPAFM